MDVPELNFIVILQEALVLGVIHVVRTEHFRKNQEGRNVSFSETFTYVLNEWSLVTDFIQKGQTYN